MCVRRSKTSRITVNKINNMLVSLIKNYIAMLCRLRSIVQHMAITLTYKIKAAGSHRPGKIMVSVFFFFLVLCWLCVNA